MKRLPQVILTRLALAAAATLPFAPPAAALNLGTQPLYLGGSIPPIVMLVTPKDHQLFKKAYDDFTDLDGLLPGGDTLLETTYKHSIDYYGYFDPFKCYTYSNASGRFVPSANTATKYCAAGTAWAGNFLNWATMARIDIMRKLLYGGFRSTDINGTTVLERALIPVDGHSWSKHYRGADIAQLVPFSTLVATPGRTYVITGQAKNMASSGTISFTGLNNPATDVHPLILGDQVSICVTGSTVNCMLGRVTTQLVGNPVTPVYTIDGKAVGAAADGTAMGGNWTVTNLSSAGITICNATQATTGDSNSSAAAPLMRVAKGDYGLWSTADTGQTCRWSDEGGGPSGNRVARSELNANELSALRNTAATPSTHLNDASGVTNGDYIVRVLACDSAFIGTESCTQYPNANLKPTGLLQDYASGQQKKIKFGLISGSYTKNKSGGVLRKNPGFLDSATGASPSLYDATVDEINADSGIFNTTATTPGIIRSFNSLRLYGWIFAAGGGTYDGGGAGVLNDTCGAATNVTITDNQCTSWGNPISEMYVEAVRFLAGKAADANFTYTQAGSKDASLGLLQPAWVNPLSSTNYCTPLNVVVMNASVNSYDNDQLSTDLFAAGVTTQTLTKLVGDYESITGNSFLVGNNGTINDGLCTPKSVSDFGAVSGICPEAPALLGSYRIAGAAHWARTNRIRAAFATDAPPASDTRALKVTTYGITLANGTPTIAIPVPGSSPVRYLTILPATRTFNTAVPNDRGGGGIVEFKVIRQDLALGTGKFFVSWDNSQNGSDYDLDVWGTIEYTFVAGFTQIQVTTQVVYGAAGSSSAFGYVISGTTGKDGMHFHSGFQGGSGTHISYGYPGSFTFAAGAPAAPAGTVECSDCATATLPSPLASQTYTVSAAAAATVLRDPLWYASKYGGFVDQDGNARPNLLQEWDSKNNITGADGADGNPDTYFPVVNPGALQQALDRAFISVLQVSSASSVATNSTSLQSGSIVYQARFNANEWSGQLLAFSISTAGLIDPVPVWDASQLLPAPTARTILTFSRNTTNQDQGGSPKGIPFRWASLNTLQQTDLGKNAAGTPDCVGAACATATLCTGVIAGGFTPVGCTLQGSLRLDWLRGSQANEGATATKYRVRPTTVLGDIVNSTPIYVGAPAADVVTYGDFSPPTAAYSSDATYATFKAGASVASRTPIIYAAANDGMLHGFDGSTGATKGVEKIAYVPSTVYRNFTKLTDKTYSHRFYADGSPTVADVKFADGTWHTILVGGLNAGGQGVYALDITNPANFTEGNANSLVLWEWTDFNDNWLGNTYSQPSIAKMANGKFAVIFGNGYNNSIQETGEAAAQVSASGCATLYVLFVEGGIDGVWTFGTDFLTIDINVSCSAANPNGLATPRVVDVDNDGIADFIYAGDLRGNMWKFDVRSATAASWALSNGTTPLFAAQDSSLIAQPITAAATTFPNTATVSITATSSPSSPISVASTMLLFGTGKYLEQADDSPPFTRDTFYGIWDKHDGTTVTRSQLLQQQVLGASLTNPMGLTLDDASTPGIDESGFRITTPYQPNYTAANRVNPVFGVTNAAAADAIATSPPHRGWYLDLPFSGDAYTNPNAPPPTIAGTGERVVFRPIISTGKLVFTTLVPTTAACQFGGTSFLMDLDPVTGSRLATSPFDLNNDSNFTSGDYVSDPAGNRVAVSGRASSIGIIPTPTVIQMSPSAGGTPGKEVKVLSGSSGQLISVLELGGAPSLPGAVGRRILWRQLFTD